MFEQIYNEYNEMIQKIESLSYYNKKINMKAVKRQMEEMRAEEIELQKQRKLMEEEK